MSTPAEREKASADARARSCEVLARLLVIADRLDELGVDLQVEVELERHRERNEDA